MSNRQHLDQIIALAEKESDIIIHLAGKVDDIAHLDHRPTAAQRSLWETMQAISGMVQISVEFSLTGDFDRTRSERVKAVTFETFPDAMRTQMSEVRALLADVTDQDLLDRVSLHPAAKGLPLGIGLMRAMVSFLSAYKMQIFLYLKSVGKAQLNTANVWGGVDMPIPAPQPVPAENN